MSSTYLIWLVSRREGMRLLGRLGQGTFGEFYLLEDVKTGRRYGLKFLPFNVAVDMPPEALAAPVRDAGRILHPNVAATYSLGFAEGQAYVMREFVPGTPLAAHARRSEVTLRGLLNVAYQSSSALLAAHHLEVTHQDINPNNIIITPGQEVKLVDFGIGRVKRMAEAREGRRLGRVDFREPESDELGAAGGPEGDLFSLGAALYYAALGHTPAALGGVSSVPALLEMQMRERERLPTQSLLSRRSAERLGHSIDRLLAPSPQDRPTSLELHNQLHHQLRHSGHMSWRTRAPFRSGHESRMREAPSLGGDTPGVVRRGREVNAWLVEGGLPLVRGRQYRVGVNIGSPREGGLGSWPFSEPDWGAQSEMRLLLSLNAAGIDVSPTYRRALLHREKNMRAVYFRITPRTVGPVSLRLSIFLARELTLLEEFRMGLVVVEEEVENAA